MTKVAPNQTSDKMSELWALHPTGEHLPCASHQKYSCMLVHIDAGDPSHAWCLAGLPPRVCDWIQGLEGHAVLSFLDKGRGLSTANLAKLLGLAIPSGKEDKYKKWRLKSDLDDAAGARILASRLNPDDHREWVYTLTGFGRQVLTQCQARTVPQGREIAALEETVAKQQRTLVKKQMLLARAKFIWEQMQSQRADAGQDPRIPSPQDVPTN